MTTIHSTAIVEKGARIGNGVVIAYSVIVIGTKTQDLKFRGETTFVSTGKECEIREYVTINSSCGEGTSVQIANFCLIIAYCHITHNCMVGDRVVMSNKATLDGHVIIEDCAFIGGLSAVHQRVPNIPLFQPKRVPRRYGFYSFRSKGRPFCCCCLWRNHTTNDSLYSKVWMREFSCKSSSSI
ncbi:hypothetical protein ACTFIW_008736 [Dictyostelium discoideum]